VSFCGVYCLSFFSFRLRNPFTSIQLNSCVSRLAACYGKLDEEEKAQAMNAQATKLSNDMTKGAVLKIDKNWPLSFSKHVAQNRRRLLNKLQWKRRVVNIPVV
jgi:hypothetical protein